MGELGEFIKFNGAAPPQKNFDACAAFAAQGRRNQRLRSSRIRNQNTELAMRDGDAHTPKTVEVVPKPVEVPAGGGGRPCP